MSKKRKPAERKRRNRSQSAGAARELAGETAGYDAYSVLSGRCRALLKDLTTTAKELARLSPESNDLYERTRALSDLASSDLLTVAFLGAFTSGKSFLISQLIGRVVWTQTNRHGSLRDEYRPLIPGSPLQTTACPLAVEPAREKVEEDAFYVQFTDNDTLESLPAESATIRAYVTSLPDAKENRRPQDGARAVSRAVLQIAGCTIPGRLYDLPGTGGIGGKQYSEMILSYMAKADCLVYVASAEKELPEDELPVLRFIYEHHVATRKPVFFVLSKIDLYDQVGESAGRMNWEIVASANDEILRQQYALAGDGAARFIGPGFLGVSPALEAKGQSLAGSEPVQARHLEQESRMHLFREKLVSHLTSTSGPKRILLAGRRAGQEGRDAASVCRSLVEVESVPFQQLETVLNALKAKQVEAHEARSTIRQQIEEHTEGTLAAAFSNDVARGLATHLHVELDELIRASDVLDAKVIDAIRGRQFQATKDWFEMRHKQRWSRVLRQFEREIREIAMSLLPDDAPPVSLAGFEMPAFEPGRPAASSAFDSVAYIMELVLPMLEVGAKIASATAPIAPAGTVLTSFTGLFFSAIRFFKKNSEKEERRTELLGSLDESATLASRQYVDGFRALLERSRRELLSSVDKHTRAIQLKVREVERKLASPAMKDKKARIEAARRLECAARRLAQDLEGLEKDCLLHLASG